MTYDEFLHISIQGTVSFGPISSQLESIRFLMISIDPGNFSPLFLKKAATQRDAYKLVEKLSLLSPSDPKK